MLEGITMMPMSGNTWTYLRSPVPAFLADAGVSQELWSTTCDAIIDHNNAFRKIQKNEATTTKYLCLSCTCLWFSLLVLILVAPFKDGRFDIVDLVPMFVFNPFTICGAIIECRRRKNGPECLTSSPYIVKWSHFVQEQKRVYRPFGIDCQMVKAPTRRGVPRVKKLIVGGVNFKSINETSPTKIQGDVVSDLESLRDLHKSGALTDDEYTQAKARVLETTSGISRSYSAFEHNNSLLPSARVVAAGNQNLVQAHVMQDSEVAAEDKFDDEGVNEKAALIL